MFAATRAETSASSTVKPQSHASGREAAAAVAAPPVNARRRDQSPFPDSDRLAVCEGTCPLLCDRPRKFRVPYARFYDSPTHVGFSRRRSTGTRARAVARALATLWP